MQQPTRRALGPRGPLVSPLGLGSWHTWDRMPFVEAVAIIRRASAAGINLFDVAYYNMGPHPDDSPTDLIWARAMREAGVARSDFVFAGKLWLWDYPAQDFTQQLTQALQRVGLDYADTAVIGDYHTIDIPAVMDDIGRQIDAGRLRSWGTNNWPYPDFAAALDYCEQHALPGPSFVQLKYGIARRSMAEGPEYGAHFAAGTLGLQASDVFEGGILAGNTHTQRQIGADPGGIRSAIIACADQVRAIASRFDATPAQLGIAFCLSNPHVTNVLFGVSRLAQLEDNLRALELYRSHGRAIRKAVAGLWLDREGVRSDGCRMAPPPAP